MANKLVRKAGKKVALSAWLPLSRCKSKTDFAAEVIAARTHELQRLVVVVATSDEEEFLKSVQLP